MRKKLIQQGLLDARGRPNEKTPPSWITGYEDYNIKTEGTTKPAVTIAPVATSVPAVVKEEQSSSKRKVRVI